VAREVTFARDETTVNIVIRGNGRSGELVNLTYQEFDELISYAKIYRQSNAQESTFVLVNDDTDV
jgi:hypothetical protein